MKKSLRRWAILALVLVLFLSTVMSVRAGTSLDTGGATVTVDSYGAFYTAFSNAENGDVIGIEGTITIPAVVTLDAGYDEITIRRMAIDAKIVISGNYGEDSKATFKNISFDGNATWVGGSEPFVEVSSNAYFDNCSFYDCLNQSGNGGAMYLSSGAAATVNNCEFESNSAINGSHIYNEGTLTVFTTSFTDGWADAYGGAIYNTGTLSLVDSTITENHTRIGGGLYNIGSVDITNSLIWNNEGTIQGADIANDGSMSNSTTEEQYNQYLKEYGLYYAGWEEDTNTSVGGTGDYIKMLTTDKEPTTDPEPTEPEETDPEETDPTDPEETEPVETEPTEPEETEPESPTEPTETEPSTGTEDEGNTGGNNTEDSGSSGDTESEEPNTEGNNEGESGGNGETLDNEEQGATEAPSGSTEGGETEAPSTSTPSDTDSTEESGGSVSIDNSTTANSSTDNSTVDNSSRSSTVDNSSVVSDTDNSAYESNDNSSYREDNSYRDSSTTSTVNNYYQSSTDTTPQSNTSSQGGSQPITVNVTVPEAEKADTGSQVTTAATSETDANQNIHIEAEGVDLEYEYIDGVINLSIKAHTEAESPTEAANVMEAVSTSTTLSEQAETAESGSNWVQIISMIFLAALVVLEVKDKIRPHKEA